MNTIDRDPIYDEQLADVMGMIDFDSLKQMNSSTTSHEGLKCWENRYIYPYFFLGNQPTKAPTRARVPKRNSRHFLEE